MPLLSSLLHIERNKHSSNFPIVIQRRCPKLISHYNASADSAKIDFDLSAFLSFTIYLSLLFSICMFQYYYSMQIVISAALKGHSSRAEKRGYVQEKARNDVRAGYTKMLAAAANYRALHWRLSQIFVEKTCHCSAMFEYQSVFLHHLGPLLLINMQYIKFGLAEKHTKFEKIFLMVLTNQLIYLVNVKTMRKIFSNYECFSKSPNFTRPTLHTAWTVNDVIDCPNCIFF